MADPRFFDNQGPFDVGQIAESIGCNDIIGDRGLSIHDVAPLSSAEATHLTFLDNTKYIDEMKITKAGACIMHPDMRHYAPEGMVCLLTDKPYPAYAKAAARFYPARIQGGFIDKTAVIADDAVIGEDVQIGAHVCIGRGVSVGAGTVIDAHATLSHCDIGTACHIYPGVRIGQDGFGFAIGEGGAIPVPQLGRVNIGHHVHIGANTCIDRGAGPDTVIGDGCIIDNLVQIAHNVVLGQGCVVTAQVGISGSTKFANYCVVGGQAGIAGHLNIGMGVRIAAQSGVTQDIQAGTEVVGFPAQERRSYWKERAFLRRLMKKKG